MELLSPANHLIPADTTKPTPPLTPGAAESLQPAGEMREEASLGQGTVMAPWIPAALCMEVPSHPTCPLHGSLACVCLACGKGQFEGPFYFFIYIAEAVMRSSWGIIIKWPLLQVACSVVQLITKLSCKNGQNNTPGHFPFTGVKGVPLSICTKFIKGLS